MNSDWHGKSRNELREALRKKGLSPSGVKEELIKRLEGSNSANIMVASPTTTTTSSTLQPPSRDKELSDSHKTSDDESNSPVLNSNGKREREPDTEEVESHSPQPAPVVAVVRSAMEDYPICGQPNKYGKKKNLFHVALF